VDTTSPSRLSGFGEIDAPLAETLATRLGVRDEFDLAFAVATNRVRDTPELGPELQERLRLALRMTPWQTPRRALMDARTAAIRLLTRLQQSEACLRLAATGEVRRMAPLVTGVDLLATAHDPDSLLTEFAALPILEGTTREQEDLATARMQDGTPVRLRAFPEDPGRFFARLLHDTGPASYFAHLQALAAARGLVLEPDGLLEGGARLSFQGEGELLGRLGAPDVPPEWRHRAPEQALPETLVSMADIKGVAHLHTADGAGRFDVPTIAARALREGYGWALLADRSPTAFPRGIALETFAAQAQAVATWRRGAEEGLQVFHAVEVRVLPDGTFDLPSALLEAVDAGIAVVEDAPGESAQGDPTDRYLAALAHPRMRVLAHPRPLSIGGPPHAPDWTRLLPALAEADVAVEVSGGTHRLPYPEDWHQDARRAGVRVLPAADAHDLEGLDQAIAAVAQLRRGGWSVSEVAATLDAASFGRFCNGSRASGA
jgi:histidinol phosphatase-like PHP family hydrolase